MRKIESKIQVQIPKKLERVLLYVGGILLVVMAYVFVFQRMQLTNQELETTIMRLQTEESQLLEMKNAQKEHEQDTKAMAAKITDILEMFPENNLEEDTLLFAKSLEDELEVNVSSLYLAGKNLVQQGENSGYILYAHPVEYEFTSGYEDLKKMVGAISGAVSKKNVESITLSYDSETGELSGSMTINEFSMTGDGQSYEAPDISNVNVGNSNPFATGE